MRSNKNLELGSIRTELQHAQPQRPGRQMNPERRALLTTLQILKVPLTIAAITLFGLLSALLGDGVWDAVSWIALAAPVGITAHHLCRSMFYRDPRA